MSRAFPTEEEWRYEVANGDTVLGFDEWRNNQSVADTPADVSIERTDDDKWWELVPEGSVLVKRNASHGFSIFQAPNEDAWVVSLYSDLAYGPCTDGTALLARLCLLVDDGEEL